MSFPPLILAHTLAATTALLIGGLALAMKKGSFAHKVCGSLWVGLMLAAALTSFGIRSDGHFSAIHILSVITVISVPAAVYAAIRGRIKTHRRGMLTAYLSLALAGAFTLLPGRRLGDLVWNALGLA